MKSIKISDYKIDKKIVISDRPTSEDFGLDEK